MDRVARDHRPRHCSLPLLLAVLLICTYVPAVPMFLVDLIYGPS